MPDFEIKFNQKAWNVKKKKIEKRNLKTAICNVPMYYISGNLANIIFWDQCNAVVKHNQF